VSLADLRRARAFARELEAELERMRVFLRMAGDRPRG